MNNKSVGISDLGVNDSAISLLNSKLNFRFIDLPQIAMTEKTCRCGYPDETPWAAGYGKYIKKL